MPRLSQDVSDKGLIVKIEVKPAATLPSDAASLHLIIKNLAENAVFRRSHMNGTN